MSQIHQLQENVSELRERLLQHPIYHSVKTPAQFRLFMEHHIFAVWDFMSLLKGLQRTLTCVETPWIPVGSPETRYLINEIVVGEESDLDDEGQRLSHFELYLKSMNHAGADTGRILFFLDALRQYGSVAAALSATNVAPSIQQFVLNTFSAIETGKPHVMASVFTFGREDLIPEMFLSIVRSFESEQLDQFSTFKYYLERHIEVDGEHHSHLALAMTEELCGADQTRWEEAESATKAALLARIALWDGVLTDIEKAAN
jgi:hypothetical protein